jgi:hypothetical protein
MNGMNGNSADGPDDLTQEALNALRLRGVDDPGRFLEELDAERIIRTCGWHDRQQGGHAKPGLLVWKLREGGVGPEAQPVTKTTQLRQTFDRYVAKHPVGSSLCSHLALAARRWPDDNEDCAGRMLVVDAVYPILEMECDRCRFLAALPARAMKGNA